MQQGEVQVDGPPAPAPAQVRGVRVATLTVPADKGSLGLARMTAMHVAGSAGLPLARVTDLRLAVDEACALFLSPHAPAAPAVDGADVGRADGVDRVDGTDVHRADGMDRVDGAAADAAGPGAAPDALEPDTLELACELLPDRLLISISGPTPARWPDADDIGWLMLQALVAGIEIRTEGGRAALTLTELLPERD